MIKRKLLKSGLWFAITVSLFFLFYSNLDVNYFEFFELKTYDLRYKVKNISDKKHKRDYDVIIIGIDEKSLIKYGPWPWDRSLHGELVKKLKEYGIKSVGFDVSFSENGKGADLLPYRNNLRGIVSEGYKSGNIDEDSARKLAIEINKLKVEEDYKFAQALKEVGNVTIGTYNILDPKVGITQEIIDNDRHHKSRYHVVKGIEKEFVEVSRMGKRIAEPFTVYKMVPPIPIIGKFTYGIGPYEVGFPDLDGILRGIVAVTKESYSNLYFPPMYLLTYLNSLGYNPKDNMIYNMEGNSIDIVDKDKIIKSIPTNINGYQRLYFYGGSHTFNYISFMDIIEGKVDKKDIEGKIAVVGYTDTAKGLYDLRATPIDPNTPGVELHATAIQNVIDEKYMVRLEILPHMFLLFSYVLAITFVLSFKNINIFRSNVLVVLLIGSYFILAYMLFLKGIWIEVFYPIFVMLLLYILLNAQNYFSEEKEKRYIRDAFGTYINPQLIHELVESPDKLKLGGEKKELTVLFSDIASFTTISENLNPEELIELLNEYLSITTDIILKNNGTIDKYIGDAIMAIFGAPVYKESHVFDACGAALLYQEALRKLREKSIGEGKVPISARIGLNTGEMVVGNMGCNIGDKKKFNYTVIGDEVNLSSRLEGANKYYSTEILVGPRTYEIAKDEFVFRSVDFVRVKGKHKAVGVYELMGRRGDEELEAFVEKYNNAMESYKNRAFEDAESLFSDLLKSHPEDGPIKVYLDRIKDYKENPPADDWDYSYTMTTK